MGSGARPRVWDRGDFKIMINGTATRAAGRCTSVVALCAGSEIVRTVNRVERKPKAKSAKPNRKYMYSTRREAGASATTPGSAQG